VWAERTTVAEHTSASISICATPEVIMGVIADFETYPDWATGVTRTEVISIYEDDQPAEVFFSVDVTPIKDEYTLEYNWDTPNQVSWTLVEGKLIKTLVGAYLLTPQVDDTTEVTYELSLELSIPMIGMLKRKGEKILIDAALKGLKARVEALPHAN
jgi:ribosome-associated toxin RatA of RatAB toxin-antitoxin module